MHLCRRCVSLLFSRPLLSAALQPSTHTLHQRSHHILLQHSHHILLQHSREQPPVHSLTQRHSGETWAPRGRRNLTDHQAASPDVYNKTDLAEREVEKHIVPFENLNVHQISNQESLSDIGLDAFVRPSPLQEISEEEAVQIQVPSALPPDSFTLKPYVDKSETLSKLVQLGVNLWELEQRPNVGSMLIRLDFNADVAPRLLFLKDLGVEESKLGTLLTKNPFILTESLDKLEARVSYLKTKKFSQQSVAVMVSKAPYLLNFSVERLDNRLGFFQQKLGLSAEKTRNVVTRLPKLLCGSLEPIKENLKV
ncbi:transcription termination factor 3, mitochondrial [Pimephales promelas]|nr:transcription termination factor 3, mitochondrial [Pimephales promelas]